MLPKLNPATTSSWELLKKHYEKVQHLHLRELFQSDASRFSKFSLLSGDVVFDYSKNRITGETVDLLIRLATECRLQEAIQAMFTGARINETENRAVLHTALRNFS